MLKDLRAAAQEILSLDVAAAKQLREEYGEAITATTASTKHKHRVDPSEQGAFENIPTLDVGRLKK